MFRVDIRARLYSVVLLFGVGLVILSGILIYMQTDNVRTRRQQELKGLTDSAMSLVAAQHALHQALLRHLQREDRDLRSIVGRGVERDAEGEGRLSHRRTARDDDQIGGLEAGGHLVEAEDAGADAGDRALLLGQLLDLLERDRDDLRELSKAWRHADHVRTSAATIVLVIPATDDRDERDTLWYDLGQATMSIMLAAVDLGIGSGHASIGDQASFGGSSASPRIGSRPR